MKDKITYYDFTSIDYSGYFLDGFLQNSKYFNCKFSISKKSDNLFHEINDEKFKDILFSICIFKANISDDEFYFCIDTRDSCYVEHERGKGYHLPLLEMVKYYFKVNHNREVINNDEHLKPFSKKILPVGPSFPLRPTQSWLFFPRILPENSTGWTMRDAMRRLKRLPELFTLKQIRQLRPSMKDLDICFVMGFYNDKRHMHHNEARYEIMEEIHKHCDLNCLIGFATDESIPNKYVKYQLPRLSFKDHMKNIARSKIGIYVVGLHDCISFKFGQYLSLGIPISGQKIRNNQELLFNEPHFKEQFTFESPKEIVDNARMVLQDYQKLTNLGKMNSNMFDNKFTPKTVVHAILETVCQGN